MPLALHAVVVPGRGLHLWAEDPGRSPTATCGAVEHPFAVPLPGVPPDTTVLLLPSGADGPWDSDVVAALRPAPRPRDGTGGPRRWTVPVAAVAAVAARSPTDDGLVPGASVTVLDAVDRVAADLVVRGRVLPAVGGDGVLRWRAVLQGPDLVVVDALTAALPPAGHCAPDPDTGAPPTAQAAVTETLDRAVDRYARARLVAVDPPGWLAALTTAEPTAIALPDGLAAGMGRWSVVGAPHAGSARGGFRLDEVVVDRLGHALDEPGFRLDFLLAATEDPSLVVPAETVWRDPSALRRWLDDPARTLLAELDRAAGTVTDPDGDLAALVDALRGPRPTGVDLDLAGAHAFLTGAAAALERAGFVVLLPASWHGAGRLGLVGRARDPQPVATTGVVARPSPLARDHLVDLSWRLAVDGEPMSDDELAALARAKAPLLRLRGRWVALDPARLRAALGFLEARGEEQVTVADLLVAGPPALGDLPLERLDAEGEVAALLDGLPERLRAVGDPPGLRGVLRPYQRHGLAWLAALSGAGLGGVLADDMGLGKTLQVLALEAHERTDGRGLPTLLVCPTSVIATWAGEAARWTPSLRVGIHHGPGRDPARLGGPDLVVTSYGTLVRDLDVLRDRPWHRLVLDEAQTIKNPRADAARAARAITAGHKVAVTGTPVENRLADLWALLDAVTPGVLGSLEDFRDSYAVPVERHGRTDVADDLRARVRPLLLRRRKDDVAADLPEKIETVERCGLTREQATLYRTVVDELLATVDRHSGPRRRGRILAATTRLKQVCDHPALLLGDSSALGRRSRKLARVEEILASVLGAGERALLFTQYAAFGHALVPHLGSRLGTDVAWLHGGTSRAARDAMVQRFQRGEGPPLFLLSLRAGGTGLTLTAARHVLHLDRWWNPAVEDQATDRVHRIGQRHGVHVRRMVCAGTIEERIEDLLAEKRALAEATVGAGLSSALGDLSTDELAALVALDPGQVDDGL